MELRSRKKLPGRGVEAKHAEEEAHEYPPEKKGGLLADYSALLKRRPLTVGAVQQGLIMSVANITKQVAFGQDELEFATPWHSFLVGTFFLAPFLFLWYQILGRFTSSPVVKTAADQLLASWFFNFGTQACLAWLKGQAFVVTEKHYHLVMLSWIWWVPVKSIMFGFVPAHLQVPFGAGASYFFNMGMFLYMSAS